MVFFQCMVINAQESLYDYVKLGSHQVGVLDTFLLDANYDYEALGYVGPKAYFIRIWHPIEEKDQQTYLKVKDLFGYKEIPELKTIQESLAAQYKSLYKRDYLSEDLEAGGQADYDAFSAEEAFDLIGEQETRSVSRTAIEQPNFPVVIYHHGAQGHPFESFAAAEFFASRGYVFISASFELQFENNPFGMLPYERYITDEKEESLKAIVKFAKTISSSSEIFFLGHSMGAQMGLRTFGQDSTIRAMISLETTIEFKSDEEKIKELWPEVYQRVITEKANYPFPILFCAATGREEPVDFIKNVRASQLCYAGTEKTFEHNAYLSLFYLKYFLGAELPQDDDTILRSRLLLYGRHLGVMGDFLNAIRNGDRACDGIIFIGR